MPRDGGGTYTLPAGTAAVAGQTIDPDDYNAVNNDIASEITSSLPRNGSAAMGADLPMGGNQITGVGSPSADTDADTKGARDAAVLLAAPTGIVLDYAGSSAPSGWLLCYGQAVSRTTYAALFAVLSTTYGSGDGSTTFNLPDLRGRVVAGKDNMGGTSANRLTDADDGLDGDTLGDTGGGETQALVAGNHAAHTHSAGSYVGASHTHPLSGTGGFTAGADATALLNSGSGVNTGGSGTVAVSGTSGSQGSGTAFGIVQPTIILNKIIKT